MKKFISLLAAIVMIAILPINVFAAAPAGEESVTATKTATFNSGNDYYIEGIYPGKDIVFRTYMTIDEGITSSSFYASISRSADPNLTGISSGLRIKFTATYQGSHASRDTLTTEKTRRLNFPHYSNSASFTKLIWGSMDITKPSGFQYWTEFSTRAYFYLNIDENDPLGANNWRDMSEVSATYNEVLSNLK